jgi:ferric-dicitrate binding protein FerR (iron transport regulator)
LLKSLLSVSLALLMATTPLFSAPADNRTAGEVKALIPAASRNAQPVKVKDSLEWNDLLKTDARGRLRAGLADGSILSLGSNSELKVVQHDAASQQTSIEVNYGKLRNQVVKITKPGGKYEVKTPNTVIGVIGTDFYVGYADQRTTVICYVGTVTVTPAAGAKVLKSDNTSTGSTDSVTIAAGQMVIIGTDIPPAGYQASSTPAPVAEASIQDTNVPDQPAAAGKAHTHTLRNVLIGVGAAAGLGVGLGIAETRGGSSTPPPQSKCGPTGAGC